MILVFCVVLVALIFEYINGFHDTANSIATVFPQKYDAPEAILLAAVCNLLGAMWGTAVATTIGKGLVDTQFVTLQTIICLWWAPSSGDCSPGGSGYPPVPVML